MSDRIGTPIFSAPEQLAHRRYGTAADVWAAGCVLVCLTTHTTLPYPEVSNDDQLLRRILERELVPSVPDGCTLHGVVGGCCRFDAELRLSAAQLEAALAALLA